MMIDLITNTLEQKRQELADARALDLERVRVWRQLSAESDQCIMALQKYIGELEDALTTLKALRSSSGDGVKTKVVSLQALFPETMAR